MTAITDDFQGHLGLATLVTGGLELLKRMDFPGIRWINERKPATIVALSGAASLLISLGFQWTWEQSWPSLAELFQNGGVVKLSVSIPNIDTILRAFGQFAMNYMVYHGAVKPATVAVTAPKLGAPAPDPLVERP